MALEPTSKIDQIPLGDNFLKVKILWTHMITIYKRYLGLLWLRASIYNESGLGAHTSSVLRSLRSSGRPLSNTIAVYSTTAPTRASRIHLTIFVLYAICHRLVRGYHIKVSVTCGVVSVAYSSLGCR